MNRPIRNPHCTLSLVPAYYGSIGRYALILSVKSAMTDWDRLFDKREKAAHRCTIADKQGKATLTASIAKPHGIPRATWGDIRLSDHGQWWRIHRSTLETAYGRTPFFEFYIDRLLPFLTDGVIERYPTLRELDDAIDSTLRDILGIYPHTHGEREQVIHPNVITRLDYSEIMEPDLPYWQVRRDTLGFIQGLSVLDLIFNLGPEAPLYLNRIAPQIHGCL